MESTNKPMEHIYNQVACHVNEDQNLYEGSHANNA